MKNQIPNVLLYGRLILAFGILYMAFSNASPILICVLIRLGFLADIFDGIIARKLNVSTEGLRLADSIIDRLYWVQVFIVCYIFSPHYVQSISPYIAALMIGDMIVYIISFIRFRKIPSPHNLLTKLWGILIAISFTEIILLGKSYTIVPMIIIGFISRMDSMAIYLILKKWDHDIPSFISAIKLRKNLPIRRKKLFNG